MYQFTTATKKIIALKKRIRRIQGGTSASKTISILLILIDRAQVKHKEKELTSVVSESIPQLKRGAMREFENIMKDHHYWKDSLWNSTDKVYTFETGNQIEFFSSDNSDKLRGARRDWLFINEANNVEFKAFEELEVRTKKGVYLDFNPTIDFWAFSELDSRDDVDSLVLTYKDNEGLDERIIQTIEARKGNKNWWTVYGLGLLGDIEGRIYTGWQIIDEVPHEARLERYGLDFGYTNDPTVVDALYRWNGAYIVDEVLHQRGLSNKQIADVLLSVDTALVRADSAEPKSIDEIRSYGVNILPTQKGKGSVSQGIQYVRDQKIFITKRSINAIKEYRNYMWLVDKNGNITNEPSPIWNHHMDAIRYAFDTMHTEIDNIRAFQRELPKSQGYNEYGLY